MKKLFTAMFIILILLTVSCANAERNKTLLYSAQYSEESNAEYRNSAGSRYLSGNINIDNYFKANNIAEYKYKMDGNALKVWIKNYDNMIQSRREKILDGLKKYNSNVIIVIDKTDL